MSSSAPAVKFENILYEKKGPIVYVTLNRPKVLNALNQAVFAELKAAFEDARDDSSVRGVILTGSGDKAFVAGADIAEMSSLTASQMQESTRRSQGVTELLENLGKPVIAAVNGFALGGGCELAMACTIRIAAENAKFGQPEVKIGIMPGAGGTQRLPRAGRERLGRSSDRGVAIWHLRRIRRQEGRHCRLSGETSTEVPGSLMRRTVQVETGDRITF